MSNGADYWVQTCSGPGCDNRIRVLRGTFGPLCPACEEAEKAPVRIAAVREAGAVQRRHTGHRSRPYDVAQHSFNAVSLLLILYKGEPSVSLIKAVMWHDCAERWVGDIPAPIKSDFPDLKKAYEDAEEQILKKLNLLPFLSAHERMWLRAIDTLELWMWCREELAMGNPTVQKMKEACEETFEKLTQEGLFPEQLSNFYAEARKWPYERLSDFFTDVARRHGLGET